jgi:hypothetical protein
MTPPGSGCPFYVLSMKNFFAFTVQGQFTRWLKNKQKDEQNMTVWIVNKFTGKN